MYFDMNSLYATAMTYKLPTKNFGWGRKNEGFRN